MRSAVLVLPLIALAASIATGAPRNSIGNDFLDNAAMVDLNAMESMADGLNEILAEATENSATMDTFGPAWIYQGAWVMAGEDETGSVWYVDHARSKLNVSPRRVLIRVDHTGDSSTRYSWSERSAEIDCGRHVYRILRTTHEDREGRRSESDERGGGRFDEVVPGSIFQTVEQVACDYAWTVDSDLLNAM